MERRPPCCRLTLVGSCMHGAVHASSDVFCSPPRIEKGGRGGIHVSVCVSLCRMSDCSCVLGRGAPSETRLALLGCRLRSHRIRSSRPMLGRMTFIISHVSCTCENQSRLYSGFFIACYLFWGATRYLSFFEPSTRTTTPHTFVIADTRLTSVESRSHHPAAPRGGPPRWRMETLPGERRPAG